MGGRDPQIENRYQVLIDTHWREKKNPQLDPCYWNCKPSRIRRKFLNQQREETNYAHKKGTVRNFPPLITDTRREWNNIFKQLREYSCQPKILSPAKLYSINSKVKTFQMDKNIENSVLMEYSSASVGKLQLTDCFGKWSFMEHSQTISSTHIRIIEGCFSS